MKITVSQYRRLLLVCFMPLLIVGVIFSYKTSPHHEHNFILCNNSLSPDRYFCSNMGGSQSSIYLYHKNQFEHWFAIYPSNGKRISGLSFEGSILNIPDAKIIDAKFFGDSSVEMEHYIPDFKGMKANLTLGINNSSPSSFVRDDFVYLYCNSLFLSESGNEFISDCFGDNWRASIKYKILGDSRDVVSSLSASVFDEIKSINKYMILHWVISVPIFLFGFIFLSLIIFSTFKAYSYVKNG